MLIIIKKELKIASFALIFLFSRAETEKTKLSRWTLHIYREFPIQIADFSKKNISIAGEELNFHPSEHSETKKKQKQRKISLHKYHDLSAF